jgi:Protein of unknown function (DUF2380)
MGCALSPKAASDSTTSVELVIVPLYKPRTGRRREKVIGGPPLLFAVLALWFSAGHVPAAEHDAIPVVVADFDYEDTSGETEDRRAAHTARVKIFPSLLRERLAREDKYKVLRLDCANATCSADSLGAEDLVAAALKVDAQFLIYGRIHKMSTLIQWGSIQVVDVRQKRLLLKRLFSLRGDTDEGFRRAAEFVGEMLKGITPKL